MPIPQWSQEYETGFPVIDQQHQEMFNLVIKLQQAILIPNNQLVIKDLLKTLLQDTVAHFRLEEDLMQEHCYPAYEQHKQIHDRLTAKIRKVLHQLEVNEEFTVVNKELSHFLHQWLVHHIQGQDRKMIQFFRERNVLEREYSRQN